MSSILLLPLGIQIPKLFYTIFDNNQNHREKIYVVGNGWGSYYFVKNLDKKKFEPIIIAPNKKVTNTPRLTNLVIDKNAVIEFENPYAEIILDMVEDIDVENKKLIRKSGIIHKYNKVVFSIGSESNDFGIPGVNTYTYKLKTILDANLLRERLSINTNTINNNVYIIGSGITGIELASKIGKVFNVKVIEGLDTILTGYNDNTKNFIREYLKQTQNLIAIETNTMVKSIGNSLIKVNKTKSNKIEGLEFDSKNDLIIWTGGIRFSGYNKTILFNTLNKITPIKPRGLDVKEDFSIQNDIYCIGDMVANKGPPSAQNAKLQGEWLAEYFNTEFDKSFLESNKFEVKSKGKLVHLVSDTYLESEYYSGFIPGFIDKLIEWINK